MKLHPGPDFLNTKMRSLGLRRLRFPNHGKNAELQLLSLYLLTVTHFIFQTAGLTISTVNREKILT